MKTTDDPRLAALLGECVAELEARGDEGQPRALELMAQIQAISPGLIEQIAAGIQLACLPRTTAH